MTEIEFTENQAARNKRNDEIEAKFKRLRKQYKDITNQRIFATIAKDYGVTPGAIRVVCIKRGLVECSKEN